MSERGKDPAIAVQGMELIDVTPWSLGVGLPGDIMRVMIRKNSPIPSKKERIFYTKRDNTVFGVYQGERAKSTENALLCMLHLTGTPPKEKAEIFICFEMKVKGSLTVSAREMSTGVNKKLEITRLSTEDAKRYKLEKESYKKAKAHRALDDCMRRLRGKLDKHNVRDCLTMMGVGNRDVENLKHQTKQVRKWLNENPEAEINELVDKRAEFYKLCTERLLKHRETLEKVKRYKFEDEAYEKRVILYSNMKIFSAKLKTYNVWAYFVQMGLSRQDVKDLELQIKHVCKWLNENPKAEINQVVDKEAEFYRRCTQKLFLVS